MTDTNKAFLEFLNNIDLRPAFYNELVRTDMSLYKKLSGENYMFQSGIHYWDSVYRLDFYLCMLCAGVTEDMIFSQPESTGFFDVIENMASLHRPTSICEPRSSEAWFDPSIAVYSGKYELAENLIDITGYSIYGELIEAEEWDFIDKITDCGKNERHIEIIKDLLMKDRFKEEKGLFDYIARYADDELLTYGEAIDIALGEINSADKMFDLISLEAYSILDGMSPDVDRKKFNERAVDIMERCARLGMTLTEFKGFDEILLPIYQKEGSFVFCESVDCPCELARLIDEKTSVYGGYPVRIDSALQVPNAFDENEVSGYSINQNICRFIIKSGKNLTETESELEYICRDFNERFGHRIVLKINSVDDFSRVRFMSKELFDIYICDNVLLNLYENTKTLKEVLNYSREVLSQENIDAITAYFVSRLNNSSGKAHSDALKKLNLLNNKLAKTGGKA